MKEDLYDLMERLQCVVARAMVPAGGYGSPTEAVARLRTLAASTSAEASAEAAALTASLANQYCVRLGTDKRAAQDRRGLAEHVEELASAVGTCERRDPGAADLTAQALPTALSGVLAELFARDAQPDSLERRAAAIVGDAAFRARFGAVVPDPSSARSVQHFFTIQRQSECSFAAGAKLWGAPGWRREASFDENLAGVAPELTRFVGVVRTWPLDAFIIEIEDPARGETLDALARTTRRVLGYLSDEDPNGFHCLDRDPGREKWRFNYAGSDFFVVTFAPCYPATHNRYGFGTTSTFVMLQPWSSLVHRVAPLKTKNASMHQAIRAKFAAAGRPYSRGELQVRDAEHYVEPLHEGDPPVRWWELPVTTD